MRLDVAGHLIEAHSEGGIETCFQVPAFDVCLDIGRCPPGATTRSTLLLTHGHIDHAAGLPYWISMRAMNGLAPPRVFVPKASHGAIARMLAAWTELQSNAEQCELIPLEPGAEIPVRGGFARTFASPHR